MSALTIAATLKAIRSLGATVSWRAEWKEFRVSLPGLTPERAEAIAYYTSDAEDALLTAQFMVTKGA
jgi:hypothetical protein